MVGPEVWCFEELLDAVKALRKEVSELRDCIEDLLKDDYPDDTDLQEE